TPPNCWVPPPPNDEDNPPPLGFCTIITTTNKNATRTINIKKTVNVLIDSFFNYFVVIFLLPEFGLQRNHFFRDFSKLKFYRLEWPFYNSFVECKLWPKFQSLNVRLSL